MQKPIMEFDTCILYPEDRYDTVIAFTKGEEGKHLGYNYAGGPRSRKDPESEYFMCFSRTVGSEHPRVILRAVFGSLRLLREVVPELRVSVRPFRY